MRLENVSLYDPFWHISGHIYVHTLHSNFDIFGNIQQNYIIVMLYGCVCMWGLKLYLYGKHHITLQHNLMRLHNNQNIEAKVILATEFSNLSIWLHNNDVIVI